MSLDVLTIKGQKSILQEQDAIKIWHTHFPTLRYSETPKQKPAAVDAILVGENGVAGVIETKCREMTFETFENTYNFKWLVTFSKLMNAVNVAEALQVKLIGFLYLVPNQTLLCKTLWSPTNGYETAFDVAKTETQRTINGGLAMRDNAYIDMKGAKCLKT
jgi:hypothetical protein